MTAQTVNYTDLSDRYVGIGIATAVSVVIAGILLQFTRRIRNMPSYFRSNYTCFQGNFLIKKGKRGLQIFVSILYYLILLCPLILLIVWVVLLGLNIGINPCLPVLFTGLFIIVLFIPSYSSLFYVKILILLILFLAA